MKYQHKKMIILITDGKDAALSSNKEKIEGLKKEIGKENINLLILAFTQKEDVAHYLNDLCSSTTEGIYLSPQQHDWIEPVFLNMSEPTRGPTVFVESF